MDGLDLLKQHWQKNNDFPKVDKEAIRGMLYKSSSSLVKWIFIISLIELSLGIIFNVWYFFSGIKVEYSEESLWLDYLDNTATVIGYFITFYFIYAFFKAYMKIRNTKNTKDLLNDVLTARKRVSQYISFNIYLIIFSIGLGFLSFILENHVFEKGTGEIILYLMLMVIVGGLMGWLFISLLKLYFRVLYVRLVKKLEKNYDELIIMENEDDTPPSR